MLLDPAVPQASARSLTEKHLTYTFRTHVIDPDRVSLWNRWIKQHDFKRVALIAENTDYGVGMVEETKRLFKSMDVQADLKTVIFDRAVVDLTPQLLEIKNWKPDLVLNGGGGTPGYLVIKQAHDVGLFPAGPMLVSYDLPPPPQVWEKPGDKGAHPTLLVCYHPAMKATSRGEAVPAKDPEQVKEDP